MILVSVATNSFVILFLFSLLSCLHLRTTPFSVEGVGACISSLYSSDTSPNTDPRSGYCTSTITFHNMRAPPFLPRPVLPPNLLPPPTVAATSQSTLVDAGTRHVSLAPGLSSCVPLRRTWWCLPRLGYLGDEESRFEILDNLGP